MDKKCTEFIDKLKSLAPANDDYSLADTLYELTDGIEDAEESESTIPYIFEFFEKFPNAEHGDPGALVHFLEKFDPQYVDFLVASLKRKPTKHTLWMLNRILTSDISAKDRLEYLELLKESQTHPEADEIAKLEAEDFYQYQIEE